MKDYPPDYKLTKKDKAGMAAGAVVGTAAGGGISYGAYKGAQALKKAGGAKVVAGKGMDAAKRGASQAKDGFTEGAGISAGKVGRKLRDGATIAADKASPGMLRKIGRGAGKGFKKAKKLIGMSSLERRNLINLEAQLDDALNLG
jgi:hypothetical protein